MMFWTSTYSSKFIHAIQMFSECFTQFRKGKVVDLLTTSICSKDILDHIKFETQHPSMNGGIRACDLPALSLWTFGLSSQHDGAAHASFQGFSSISNAVIVCERDTHTHTHTYHDRWTALLMHWTSALPHWISKWNWFMMRDDQTRSGQDASGFCGSGPPLTF